MSARAIIHADHNLAWALALVVLGGCYRSHALPADTADARAPIDASSATDASTTPCAFEPTGRFVYLGLDDHVTPRLVDLGSELGVVYVGRGSPTANLLLVMELDLGRGSTPVALTDRSFTWAEVAPAEGGLVLCWGDGSPGSAIASFTRDGRPLTPPARIPFGGHCEDLVRGSGDRYALMASSGTGQPLIVAAVTASGPLTREPMRLEGTVDPSQMSIAAVPDGFVIGHVRRAAGDNGSFLTRFGAAGPSGPLRIGDPGDAAVRVAASDSELAVVRFVPPVSILTIRDPRTLEVRRTRTLETGMSPPRLVAIDGGFALLTATPSELRLTWVRGDEVGELREPLPPDFNFADVDVLGKGRDVYATAHANPTGRFDVEVLRFSCR
ncbi:MAG: hypothetical protein IT378_04440 [Sandaracinaceae bacterium]|nr:hypothetical protein [Sandaracinaceae bacterium]